MNEWAFTRACIKVCGLIMLVFGLVGLAANAVTGCGLYLQQASLVRSASDSPHESAQKSAILAVAAYQKAWMAAGIRMPGNVIQALVGLYLCRRYHRLLKWLVRDESTIASP